VDDEESAILMLKRDIKVAEANQATETAMACSACLRINVELDREYITRHYDEAPQWFGQYGISVVDKNSASLKPAPKPRTRKTKIANPSPEVLENLKEAA